MYEHEMLTDMTDDKEMAREREREREKRQDIQIGKETSLQRTY